MKPGTIVAYTHPDWGHARGRVLRGNRPGLVLVQDLSPNGAREWWPSDKVESKRPPGRPPHPGRERCFRPIMTDTEKQALQAKARSHGISMNELVKRAVAAYPESP